MANAINLIPETQQAQQQDARKKQLALSVILLVNGGLIGLMVVLFLVTQAQTFAIGRIQSDINNKHQQFESTENVKDMLTLQQNLKALPGLYRTRSVYTRFLSVFEKVAPNSITISTLSSEQDGLIEVTGSAPSYRLVTKLAEAMKINDNFGNIEIRSANGEGGDVSFVISAVASPSVTAVEGQDEN